MILLCLPNIPIANAKIPMFGSNSTTDTVRFPHLPPKRVANALMGFQLQSACGEKCSLLFEWVPLPKARTRTFLSYATPHAV